MGKIRIISHSSDPFPDLVEAGRLLGNELSKFSKARPVVLAIPREGMVVGRQLALKLRAELDVSLACKLSSPSNPDLAIGAVSETGALTLNQSVVDRINIYQGYIQEERGKMNDLLRRRAERYREVRPKVPLEDRTVIIADDGMATGATMQASLRAARMENPGKLMAAVPVASMDALERVVDDADEVIALRVPPFVYSISQFYTRYDHTSDDDVQEMLKENLSREPGRQKK
jgi:putative phosphoribosyl transferase